jgi:hypothetical protein
LPFSAAAKKTKRNRIQISASLTIAKGGVFFTDGNGVTIYIEAKVLKCVYCRLFIPSNAGVKNYKLPRQKENDT